MYWFSGINNHNKELYLGYIKMYTVAVLSCKKTNPNIKPYLILDGEEDEHIQNLIKLGVEIIHHKNNFYNDLKNYYKDNTIAFGAFLRIDIPKICEKLNIEDDYVLYTDNDVMFINDVSLLYEKKPNYFLCAGEFSKEFYHHSMNTGVMWINWKNMNNIYDKFVEFIVNNFNNFQTYDQDALKQFFNTNVEELDYNFNYKPYWGPSNDIKILHFHGPKPTFTEEDFSKFPYKGLLQTYFFEMTNLFNSYYKEHLKNI